LLQAVCYFVEMVLVGEEVAIQQVQRDWSSWTS
jgi:hypothetical protein